MALINVHLNYNGNAEEAFTFYKSVFGGEFAKIMRFKDMASPEFPVDKEEENKISLISGGASYSTEKQLLTYLKNNMYLNDDRYFFSGDFRYYIFSQSNFGLGTGIVPWGAEYKNFDYKSIEQPMDYNYFKLHETISYNIFPSFLLVQESISIVIPG